MRFGRRLLLFVLVPIFSLLLFTLAFDFGVARVIGSVDSVKQILSESGIYTSLVPSILKQNGQISTDVGNISASDPIVQQAAIKALPASDIQTSSEAAIDNLYAWLNGKTPQPTFNLNFSGSQDSFASNLAGEVQQKLSSLPVCTTPYTAASFDALNATCLPPGVTAATAADALRKSLQNSDGGLGNVNLAATDFKGSDPGKSVFQDQLKSAPSQYQRLKSSPLILAILVILVGAALVFLRPTLTSGLRHIGITLLGVGVAMLIFSWAFNYVLINKVIPKIKIDKNYAVQQNLKHATTDLAQKIDRNYWTFGGIYAALGLVAISSPMWLPRKESPKPAAESVKDEPMADAKEPKV
jgi:hypothetical protein